MKLTRIALTVFGLLDAVLLGRFLGSIHIPNLSAIPEGFWWFRLSMLARPVFLLSLGASAFGLAMQRRWGLITSYVQFPLRFLHLHLSFGFLTLLSPLLGGGSYRLLMLVAIALEAARLATTIVLHVKLARSPQP